MRGQGPRATNLVIVNLYVLKNKTLKTSLRTLLKQVSQPSCSKLTIETLEHIVNFENISDLVLVFLLLTLSR